MAMYFNCLGCDEEFVCDSIVTRGGRRVYDLRRRVCDPCRFAFRPLTPTPGQPQREDIRARLFESPGSHELREAVLRFHAARRRAQRARQLALEEQLAEEAEVDLVCQETIRMLDM